MCAAHATNKNINESTQNEREKKNNALVFDNEIHSENKIMTMLSMDFVYSAVRRILFHLVFSRSSFRLEQSAAHSI